MRKQPGMGAIPTAKGVTFCVWGPHAEKVYVIGSFNDWSTTANPLVREENGYWATEVPEAKAGDEYKFLLHGPQGPIFRIDPYARKVTNSNMIIYIKNIQGNDDNSADDIPEGWSLMQWINVEIQQKYPGKISIGESMRNTP
jgi:1,4-alpha-glucan branching enzyme